MIILIFNFQSWTMASGLKDFEIEGMSIGESALKYFSKSDIAKNSRNYYKNKKYTPVENNDSKNYKIYDTVDFNFKTSDKNFTFEGLSGIIFTKNMDECLEKQKIIVKELSSVFPNSVMRSRDKTFNDDYWKGTRNVAFTYYLDEGGYASVHCNDYSDDHGGQDHLNVNLKTEEFNKFLNELAYK